MHPDRITTKKGLVAHLQRDWVHLQELLGALPAERLRDGRDRAGWSTADHLFHLAAWMHSVCALLGGRPRREGLGVETAVDWDDGFDRINAVLLQEGRALPLETVRTQLRDVYEELSALLTPLSDADMTRPAADFAAGEGETALINVLYGNGPHHLREHTRYIALLTAESLPPQLLATDRLVLREMCAADAAFMRQLLNEPAWLRFIGDRGVRTLADAREYIAAGPQRSYAEHGFGLYLVAERQTGAPLGICGLVKRPFLADVDLGFGFLPDFWGQGYAREAALAVMEHARTALGLKRLAAIVDPQNRSSLRLLDRLGMQVERRITYPDDGAELLLLTVDLS